MLTNLQHPAFPSPFAQVTYNSLAMRVRTDGHTDGQMENAIALHANGAGKNMVM